MDESQIAELIGRLVMQQEMLRLQALELTRQLAEATRPPDPLPSGEQQTQSP